MSRFQIKVDTLRIELEEIIHKSESFDQFCVDVSAEVDKLLEKFAVKFKEEFKDLSRDLSPRDAISKSLKNLKVGTPPITKSRIYVCAAIAYTVAEPESRSELEEILFDDDDGGGSPPPRPRPSWMSSGYTP